MIGRTNEKEGKEELGMDSNDDNDGAKVRWINDTDRGSVSSSSRGKKQRRWTSNWEIIIS